VATGNERGAVVAPQTLYDLGREWYRGRLDLDFQPYSLDEKAQTFARHGLVGDFWSLIS
jgi:hypothetical protein